MKFFVVRTFIDTEGKQNNSIQLYGEEKSARKRYYSIIASDIDKETIAFELVMLVTGDGITILDPFIIDNHEPEQTGAEE